MHRTESRRFRRDGKVGKNKIPCCINNKQHREMNSELCENILIPRFVSQECGEFNANHIRCELYGVPGERTELVVDSRRSEISSSRRRQYTEIS